MGDFLNSTKRTALKAVFGFFAPVVPPASRAWSRMEAQDLFELTRQPSKNHDKLLRPLIIRHFKDAQEDLEADEPYKRILKLKGGKAEFDALLPLN